MQQISQRELRNDNAMVVRRVEAGESFTVTRRGVPVADLVPHGTRPRVDTYFTPTTEIVAAFEDAPPVDAEAWMRDIRELDEWFADDDRDPWVPRG